MRVRGFVLIFDEKIIILTYDSSLNCFHASPCFDWIPCMEILFWQKGM